MVYGFAVFEEKKMDYYFVKKKTNHIYSDKVSIRMLQLNQLGHAEDERCNV